MANKDGTWFREISSCCCLTTAGKTRQLLLNKIYIPFLTSLYTRTHIWHPWHWLRYDLERRRRQNGSSGRPMTVAEFNVAQRKKAAAAAAMHAYVNLPPKLIGRAEEQDDADPPGPPPPLPPHKDVGYGSADNSPQHRSESFITPSLFISLLSFH